MVGAHEANVLVMSGYGGYSGHGPPGTYHPPASGGYGAPGGYHGGRHGAGGIRDLNDIHLSRPDFTGLPPFEKNFYIEHPAVAARSEEDVRRYRQMREIHVDGHGIPKPVVTFEEASFPGILLLVERD